MSQFPELQLVNQEAKSKINTDSTINNRKIIRSLFRFFLIFSYHRKSSSLTYHSNMCLLVLVVPGVQFLKPTLAGI